MCMWVVFDPPCCSHCSHSPCSSLFCLILQARKKSEASSRDGIIAELGKDFFKTRAQPQLKSRDSMLMLVNEAESEASKDQALAK